MHLLQPILLLSVSFYRYLISPLLPAACRYTPSCSEYASEAVKTHGVAVGSLMAVKRILRCNPFFKSKFDPVPISACQKSHISIPGAFHIHE